MTLTRKCCCTPECSGENWSCEEDLVEVVVTLKHVIEAERNMKWLVEMCCNDLDGCEPRPGWQFLHNSPLDLEIIYETRFTAYMVPPSADSTNPYNLGEWTVSQTCDPFYMENPTLGGTGPRIRGSWQSDAQATGQFPCSGDCDNLGSRETRLKTNIAFEYDSPTGATPPSDIIGMKKRLYLPRDWYDEEDCCTNSSGRACLENCLVDIQVKPGDVSFSMLSNGTHPTLGSYGFAATSYPLEGDSPDCDVSGTADIDEVFAAPTATPVFTTKARKTYKMEGENVCDPPLGSSQELAFVETDLPEAWENFNTISFANAPFTTDSIASGKLFPMSTVNRGFQISGDNSGQINIGQTSFYQTTDLYPPIIDCSYGDDIYCWDHDTNANFSTVDPCLQFTAAVNNQTVGGGRQFGYDVFFATTNNNSCLPCDPQVIAAYNKDEAFDKPRVSIYTELTIESITPVDSGAC